MSFIDQLQVNAPNERIIGIYLHEFTKNKREISLKFSDITPSAVNAFDYGNNVALFCSKRSFSREL